MDNKVVIVGGGIAGIFSSLVYSAKGYEVVLVEKAKELGGLLRSQELFEKNLFYDYGTHLLSETGNKQIDDFLFSGLETISFDYLKVGSYHKGLYNKNGFISDENLENREECLKELLGSEPKDSYNNLEEQLENTFGHGYTNYLLAPAIEKFFFTSVKDLEINSQGLFGLSRIIVGDSEQTKELKKQKRFDDILAYHSYKEGASSRKSMYPKQGGVGSWIKSMQKSLEKANVQIITEAEIGEINTNGNSISGIEINNETHSLSKLVWTIPPFFLMSKVGVKVVTSPPKRLTSSIFHYLVDEIYLTDLFYFQCYDPSLKSFRITLYDNYSKGVEDKYRVSVEVLLETPPDNVEKLQEEIFQELVTMSVFSDKAKVIDKTYDIYPNGFPVLTKQFVESSLEQYQAVMNNFNNVEIYGKGNGRTWFMNDIMHDIYNSTH